MDSYYTYNILYRYYHMEFEEIMELYQCTYQEMIDALYNGMMEQ